SSGALEATAPGAGVQDEGVIAGAEQHKVVAPFADDGIVAGTADERLRAAAPDQGVISAAAVERRNIGVSEDSVRFVDPDLVVAGAPHDVDVIKSSTLEAEIGRAIVVDVNLQDAGIARAHSHGQLRVPTS